MSNQGIEFVTCIRMKLGDLNLSQLIIMLYKDEECGKENLNFVSADFNM